MAGVLLAGLAAAGLGTCWWLAHARETRRRVEAAPRGGRFVRAHDEAVAPLVVQGATDAFGDWLLDFLTSREIALSMPGIGQHR